jgi:hypothetical protein
MKAENITPGRCGKLFQKAFKIDLFTILYFYKFILCFWGAVP